MQWRTRQINRNQLLYACDQHLTRVIDDFGLTSPPSNRANEGTISPHNHHCTHLSRDGSFSVGHGCQHHRAFLERGGELAIKVKHGGGAAIVCLNCKAALASISVSRLPLSSVATGSN